MVGVDVVQDRDDAQASKHLPVDDPSKKSVELPHDNRVGLATAQEGDRGISFGKSKCHVRPRIVAELGDHIKIAIGNQLTKSSRLNRKVLGALIRARVQDNPETPVRIAGSSQALPVGLLAIKKGLVRSHAESYERSEIVSTLLINLDPSRTTTTEKHHK